MSLKSKDLNALVRRHINPEGSVLLTDEYKGYKKISEILKHYTINHSVRYVDGEIHTNTIESLWAIVNSGPIS